MSYIEQYGPVMALTIRPAKDTDLTQAIQKETELISSSDSHNKLAQGQNIMEHLEEPTTQTFSC